MEQANAFVALSGDRGNTVPVVVTPAEVELLRRVHGDDAVHDISGITTIARSKQAELGRLQFVYHQPRDEDGKRLHTVMYPSHTLLPMTFEELGLDEHLYAATARAVPGLQSHGAPGQEPAPANWSNTTFEPTEVPADNDTARASGAMVDPRTQHQNDEPPGVAIEATGDGDLDQLKQRAEAQGTGPGSVPTQTGARTDGGSVENNGSKTAAEFHRELTAKPPATAEDKGADALFA